MPRLVFGQEDRDRYTLRRVLELGLTVAFECRSCRRVSQLIVLDLVGRYGITTTLGDLRSKAVCSRCGKRVVDVLTRQPGVRCQSASEIGSDALLMTIGSRGADDARLQQIEFSSPIHLTLDQLEFADLAFGLAVGPTRRDCGAHGGFVFCDAVRECRDETRLGAIDPGRASPGDDDGGTPDQSL